MPRPFRISRRMMLRGLGGAALALPHLEAMGQSAPFPKRFVVFFSPNGTVPGTFWPTGTETNFVLPEILKPLERHKAEMLVLDDVDMKSASSGPGQGHNAGMGHCLTGIEMLPGPDKGGAGLGGGISIDQAVANVIGTKTAFKSLELGIQAWGTGGPTTVDAWSRLNFSGPGVYVPVENSPWNAFNRVFANVGSGGNPPPPDPNLARRKTILDAVYADYVDFRKKLGAEDRQRLDSHVNSIQSLQAQLNTVPPMPTLTCGRPTLAPAVDVNANNNFPIVGKAQMDVAAAALACNLTNVVTLQWERAFGKAKYSFIPNSNMSSDHHGLSHDTGSSALAQLTQINAWIAEQLASFIDRLKSYKEGSGTVFDNTAILWCNELGEGSTHTHSRIPWVLMGKAGGALRSGRYLRFNHAPHNNLMVSILNAMGSPATTFGNPKFCTGPLPGLT